MVEKSVKIMYVVQADGQVMSSFPGVMRKIRQQAHCFELHGCRCQVVLAAYKNPRLGRLARGIIKRLPFGSDMVDWNVVDRDVDVVYIRKPYYISREFVELLNDIKSRRIAPLVLLEIPTFPYDGEMHFVHQAPLLAKDRRWRKRLHGCVDRVVELAQQDSVFGIRALEIINGIDLTALGPRAPSYLANGTVHMICAAAFHVSQGIDRMLSGLQAFRKSASDRKIHLHLLGDGPALGMLKKMAARLGLDDSVTFYGQCDREQMDEVYDRCSFAIASLEDHRMGVKRSSALKTREYLAKGIPFVYSGEIDVFEEDPVDFCLRVPADESPVDIEGLVAFHDRLYAREPEEDLIARIRSYAESHVGMDAAMKNVIDYIKEACSHES